MLGNRLSIRSRLLLVLLLVSISSILVVGIVSYRSAQATIQAHIFSQLTSVRASQAYQLETYLQSLQSHLVTLSEDCTVVSALGQFKGAFERLDENALTAEQETELAAFYEAQFLPRLAENSDIRAFSYYDLFLIDADTGDVIYSVTKEVDFATNLYSGPYSSSGLARSVQALRAEQSQGAVSFADFTFYQPSYNAPAAFAATPVFNTDGLNGILVFQFPVDEVNRIMTGGGNWQKNGLGASGAAAPSPRRYAYFATSLFLYS